MALKFNPLTGKFDLDSAKKISLRDIVDLHIGTTPPSDPVAQPFWLDTTLPDIDGPIITAFVISSTVNSLTISVDTFTVSDEGQVVGYLITETADVPSADDPNWNGTVPTEFSVSFVGSKTLYAWAKDDSGNISEGFSANTIIGDTVPPVVTEFLVQTPSTQRMYIYSFTATDNGQVAAYLITENSDVPAMNDPDWSATPITVFNSVANDTTTLYAWVKDGSGNISDPVSQVVTISTPIFADDFSGATLNTDNWNEYSWEGAVDARMPGSGASIVNNQLAMIVGSNAVNYSSSTIQKKLPVGVGSGKVIAIDCLKASITTSEVLHFVVTPDQMLSNTNTESLANFCGFAIAGENIYAQMRISGGAITNIASLPITAMSNLRIELTDLNIKLIVSNIEDSAHGDVMYEGLHFMDVSNFYVNVENMASYSELGSINLDNFIIL